MLRRVEPDDIAVFFEQQADPAAAAMAAFPARDRVAHDAHWGQGHASRALTEFVAEFPERPLYARVVEYNTASMRVLAKCGFVVVREAKEAGDPVKDIVLRLS